MKNEPIVTTVSKKVKANQLFQKDADNVITQTLDMQLRVLSTSKFM